MNNRPFERRETHRVSSERPKAPSECDGVPGVACGHIQLVHRSNGSCAFVGCQCTCFHSKKKNPCNAVKVDVGGTLYDSGFEGDEAKYWQRELEAGRVKGWRAHVPLDLTVNGWIVETYKIDFEITHLDDTTEYVETKGYQTPEWRRKWKLFYALFSGRPGIKITLRQQKGHWKPRWKKLAA
jgi:hypothetical protein